MHYLHIYSHLHLVVGYLIHIRHRQTALKKKIIAQQNPSPNANYAMPSQPIIYKPVCSRSSQSYHHYAIKRTSNSSTHRHSSFSFFLFFEPGWLGVFTPLWHRLCCSAPHRRRPCVFVGSRLCRRLGQSRWRGSEWSKRWQCCASWWSGCGCGCGCYRREWKPSVTEFRNATIRPEWYVKRSRDVLIWGYTERICAVRLVKVREGLETWLGSLVWRSPR